MARLLLACRVGLGAASLSGDGNLKETLESERGPRSAPLKSSELPRSQAGPGAPEAQLFGRARASISEKWLREINRRGLGHAQVKT